VLGVFILGMRHEYTADHGGIKNSILSLAVFFFIGLIWLYAAYKKQRMMEVA
jgi:hypothetical protein